MADIFHHGPEPTFADLYRAMSELELQELAADWHSLVDEARSALTAEFARRGLEFVEPLPLDDRAPEYRDLVTLRRYRDLSEAIVARGVIESAGIFCFLKDENLVRLDWQMSNLVGGIRLQVGASDVEAAEAVLAQPVPNSIDIPDQPDFETASLSALYFNRYRVGASGSKSCTHLSLPIFSSGAAWFGVMALQQLRSALGR